MDRHLSRRRERAQRLGLFGILLIGWALAAPAAAVLARDGGDEPAGESRHTGEASRLATDPMDPLADMVGTWEGEGWIRRGDGEPARFDSTEIVRSLLDGEALLIEGIHHSRPSGEISHHAVALVSWDGEKGVYRFRSQVAGRGPGDFEGHMEDGVFVWGGPAGPGEMRYRITIEDDTWSEVGEFSRDGETWSQFFEMTLERRNGP